MTLNLRVRGWSQNEVRHVRHRGLVVEFGRRRQFLPFRARKESIPFAVELPEIGIAQHVSKIRQARPNQRVTEKDLPKASFAEDVEFAAVEHFDLRTMSFEAGAFVRSQLKYALAILGSDGRHDKL